MTTVEAKRSMRGEALRRRPALARDAGSASRAMADLALAALPAASAVVVSGYWPMRDEIDPRPLMDAFRRRGCGLALPATPSERGPLTFRRWTEDTALVPGPLGTTQPSDGSPELVPDVVLTPLLAFDGVGYRLGYGGGYYDQTLAALRGAGSVIAVGCAYAGQQYPSVPHHAMDQKLNWIATERFCRPFPL